MNDHPDTCARARRILLPLFVAASIGGIPIRAAELVYDFVSMAGEPGKYAFGDGTGIAAGFANPQGLCVDANGTVYVADEGNGAVRKVSPAGVVTTLTTGMRYVYDVAVSPTGEVFATDSSDLGSGHNVIRRITAGGVMSVFAGAVGQSGTADGIGANARFQNPVGIEMDAAGVLYVTDYDADTVRKITSDANVSTFVPPTAGLFVPIGAAFDPGGNLIVVSAGSNELVRITPAGTIAARTSLALPGTNPTQWFSKGVALDPTSGNFFVIDTLQRIVLVVAPDGTVSRLRCVRNGYIHAPIVLGGVAVGTDGTLYLTDGHSIVRGRPNRGPIIAAQSPTSNFGRLDATATLSVTVESATPVTYQWRKNGVAIAGATGSSYTIPRVAASDGGDYTVVVTNAHATVTSTPVSRLTVVDNSPLWSRIAGIPGQRGHVDGPLGVGRFDLPWGAAVAPDNSVIVSDFANQTLRKVTPDGVLSTYAGISGLPGYTNGDRSSARFFSPAGLAFDRDGNLLVADSGSHTIRKITPSGVVSTFAGSPGVSGSADGTTADARFRDPYDIVADAQGWVFVADSGNLTIRAISPAGVVTTLAGLAGASGSADGTGAAARFGNPLGLTIDNNRDLYVADAANNTIRKVTVGGVVTTFAGTAGVAGTTDATGAAARFWQPTDIVWDASGRFYVVDETSRTIRSMSSGAAVQTIGGSMNWPAQTIDGVGTAALFNDPRAVAVDAAGDLYVVEGLGRTLRWGEVVTGPPTITTQPAGQSVVAGGSVALSVSVSGATSYQWFRDGQPVSGATGSSYSRPCAQTVDAGTYYVIAYGGGTSIASSSVVLGVAPAAANGARMLNLSTRALGLTGSNQLIPGFVIAGTGTKRMLVRAVGPGLLTTFGLPGTLEDPQMWLKRAGVDVAANDDWSTSANKAAIISTSATVGAFPLLEGSKDAVILVDLPAGDYTAPTVGAADGTGVAMVELYDADAGASTCQLVNISNRGFVDVGDRIMIPGFVVSAEGSRTFLIRAVGPGLNSTFGLTGVLENPILSVFRGPDAILGSDDWDTGPGAATTADTSAAVGAFPLVTGSKDAAFVVTLPPGAYTVQAAGSGGTTGIALVEIYLVP